MSVSKMSDFKHIIECFGKEIDCNNLIDSFLGELAAEKEDEEKLICTSRILKYLLTTEEIDLAKIDQFLTNLLSLFNSDIIHHPEYGELVFTLVEISPHNFDKCVTFIENVIKEFLIQIKNDNYNPSKLRFALSVFDLLLQKQTVLNLNLIEIAYSVKDTHIREILRIFNHYETEATFLDSLWKEIETKDISRSLIILCAINPTSFYEKNYFWHLLFKGLISQDNMDRKRSLYLLKKCISHCEETGADCGWIYWKKNAEPYKIIPILFEMLENGQVHILQPIFKEISTLAAIPIENCKPDWVFAIFIRLFDQDSIMIRRKSLQEFMKHDINGVHNYELIIEKFMRAINNNQIFSDSELKTNLVNWFSINFKNVSHEILRNLVGNSWSPIALFYVFDSLSKAQDTKVWDNESIKTLRKFLMESIKTQTNILRIGIQTVVLKCIIKFSSNISLNHVANILPLFKDSLKKGNELWACTVEWLKTNYFEIDNFIENIELSMANGKMLVLLHDSKLYSFQNKKHVKIIDDIFKHFKNCDKRAYSCLEKQNEGIHFFYYLLNEDSNFLNEFINQLSDVFMFFKMQLKSFNPENLPYVHIYLKLIDILCTFKYLNEDIYSLQAVAVHSLDFKNIEQFPVYVMAIAAKQFSNRSIVTYICDVHNVQLRILSQNNLQFMWDLNISYLQNMNQEDKLGFVLIADILLTTGDRDIFIPLLDTLTYYLPDSDYVIEFINNSYNVCFEYRKSDLFWKSIEKWIQMCFKPKFILRFKSQLHEYAMKLVEKGNDIFGLANMIITKLQIISSEVSLVNYSDVITSCLLFGPILRKDQRLEQETCEYIEKSLGVINRQHSKSFADVRLAALEILISSDTVERMELITEVIGHLTAHDNSQSKRYFNDSVIHRCKNRSLQTLLVLQPYILNQKDLCFKIFDWIVESILLESQQPSIRYQLEWLFIRLCLDFPALKGKFWTLFERASNERLGSLCSFISIGYHLAKIIIDSEFFESFIENVLPCCMAQNFNIRLYAQVTLENLWTIYPELGEKYKMIKNSQNKIFNQGNMAVNCEKIKSDFYFKVFDPVKHFTLQTIFWDLPRLSNLSQEEWIKTELVIKILKNCKVPKTSEFQLSEFSTPSWITKATGLIFYGFFSNFFKDGYDQVEEAVMQKKFIPWKEMFSSYDLIGKIEKKDSSLVVVSSLIDKPSNLGGLARTCEIFNAELVLGSLEYAKDKAFISLSMTAEKHVNITEVKSHNLIEYFDNMRKLGYSIIGAEQTTDSVKLSEFSFSQKTILVLGSEREGIPANLIPHLDFCVEIPQFGLLRSLNVHVSGAIIIWEYAKQLLLKK